MLELSGILLNMNKLSAEHVRNVKAKRVGAAEHAGVAERAHGARFRIVHLLRDERQLSTHEIKFTMRHAFSEQEIMGALHELQDAGTLARPIQAQKWELT